MDPTNRLLRLLSRQDASPFGSPLIKSKKVGGHTLWKKSLEPFFEHPELSSLCQPIDFASQLLIFRSSGVFPHQDAT